MHANNARERDTERRLRRLESPEPPADLLDRIQRDIPAYLRPVGSDEEPAGRRPPHYRLLAASLFLAVAGGFLAYRVWQTNPEPAVTTTTAVEPGSQANGGAADAGDSAPSAVEGPSTAPPPGATTEGSAIPAPLPAHLDLEAPADDRPPEVAARAPNEAAAGADLDAPAVAVPVSSEIGPPAPVGAEAEALMTPSAPEEEELPSQEALEYRREAVVEKLRQERRPPTAPAPEATDGALAGAAASSMASPPAVHKRLQAPVAQPGPSTGGTAEPNDQPWGDMFFRPYGTNPFVDTEDDALSTFGLDVDTGSYTLARSYLERGHLPPPEAIRVEEFLNFFDYGDPAPRRGEFSITVEGAPSPWQRGPRYQLLRIGLRGRQISAEQRRDATLIFVVDVSGSMARENRIELVRQALRLLLDQLRPGDRVGLVVYGDRGRVLLDPSGDLAAVRRAIDRLATGGSTNAEEGLRLGYDLARRHYRPGTIHRLVLCSDGVANVGRTGPESILERIGREAEEGIELTTVGFGMGNYNDVLMEQLADQGDGNYAYVDTLSEARRVFVENLTGTLQTIAGDAKIQVEFDPRTVSRYRLLGYENRDVADHRFRDDTVDAGEIGAGHRVTALYEIKLTEGASPRRPLAEVRLRYRSKQTGQVVEEAVEVRREQLARSWRNASPALQLAALAAELAEVLKRSYWTREVRPEDLLERSRAVDREWRGDEQVGELVRLTERTSRLIDWPQAPAE